MINWFPDGIPPISPHNPGNLKDLLDIITLAMDIFQSWQQCLRDVQTAARQGGQQKNKNGEEKETKTDKFLTMEDYSLQKTMEVPVSLPFYGTTGRPQSVNAAGHRPAFRFLGLKAER